LLELGKTSGFIILTLLLLAGIAAMTQEKDSFSVEQGVFEEETVVEGAEILLVQEFIPLARWYLSNRSGMALKEIFSGLVALKNEYALLVDYANPEELPAYLVPYYGENQFIEVRVLFENGNAFKRQWNFLDGNGVCRLAASFAEPPKSNPADISVEDMQEKESTNKDFSPEDTPTEDIQENESTDKNFPPGFIEIYNEKNLIITEYVFSEEAGYSRIDYNYINGVLTSCEAWRITTGEAGEQARLYKDFYRYNRSGFLRGIERLYYENHVVSGDPAVISFPGSIRNVSAAGFIQEEAIVNSGFFGDTSIVTGSRLVNSYEGTRVIAQYLYDEDGAIIWSILNTWSGDRIVASLKTEGDVELLTQFEYDGEGNRILERDIRNGVLQRLVITEGNREIEELYINSALVLIAVWENGRKVSETRVSGR
jgi:hypothetical protein